MDVPAGGTVSTSRLLRSLFPDVKPASAAEARSLASRVAIVRQLTGGWDWNGNPLPDQLGSSGPVLLAWHADGLLEVDVGTDADRVGDTLYLLPVRVGAEGAVQLAASAIGHTMLDTTDGSDQPRGVLPGARHDDR